MNPPFSRRNFMVAAAFAAIPPISASRVHAAPGSADQFPDLSTPRENLAGMLRMQASLREEDVPWWFDGTIYGIVGEQAPKPLFRVEGWEVYWVRPLPDGTYELTGHTVTFFYDLDSGKMLETFDNPYTGKQNSVQASVQGGGAGYGFNYSENGVRPTRFLDKMPEKPLILRWSRVRNTIWMHAETAYPPGMKQPRKQRQTMFAPADQFADRSILNLPASFSATVFENWPRWMDMEDEPGHVIWHASGAKIGSIDELPEPFRVRLERDHADRLTADPFAKTEKKSDFQ
jgi:hypothetical protein